MNKETTKTSAKKTTAKKASPKKKKTLLVVESPSKARVIGQYLGSTYNVVATVGHIRDLPKSRLGIEIDKDFEPEYINIRGKGDKIKELRKSAKEASNILLATDPDREGEAISWHLTNILDLDPSDECRVEFNEINKDAVREAIKKPRSIDMGLVDAQQARRVLDRLVGYQISPLLWKKVRRGLSAGRVQSATLKMICDREREIQEFVPEEYWNITADHGKGFKSKLAKISGKKAVVPNKEKADAIETDLSNGKYIVESVKEGHKEVKPYAPFTTSSLQQDAAIKLGFKTRKTMQIAQQLYEGINIKGHGTRGLVTYIRTDSVRVAAEAKAKALAYIGSEFGPEYKGNNVFSNKKKDIQDAHEAIRPADVTLAPSAIKDSLTADQYKLYHLIWSRFLASQMKAAAYDTVSVSIKNGKYEFRAAGSRLTFEGWKKVYNSGTSADEMNVPKLTEGQELPLKKLEKEQKFTQPPARYTEASLVKEMEEKNIGRPSTYASIISTLQDRKYVKSEKKNLVPTQLGFDVTGIMTDYFTDIVDIGFTSDMEDNLDSVELEKTPWKEVIADFYKGFEKELKVAEREVEKIEQEVRLSGDICELCGKPMAMKEGRFGSFLACTGYPECKNTKPLVKKIGVACPKCGKDLIVRRTRKGNKVFYGCSGYPACDVSYWDKPTGKMCPQCGSMMLEKGKKCVCSNPKCKYVE